MNNLFQEYFFLSTDQQTPYICCSKFHQDPFSTRACCHFCMHQIIGIWDSQSTTRLQGCSTASGVCVRFFVGEDQMRSFRSPCILRSMRKKGAVERGFFFQNLAQSRPLLKNLFWQKYRKKICKMQSIFCISFSDRSSQSRPTQTVALISSEMSPFLEWNKEYVGWKQEWLLSVFNTVVIVLILITSCIDSHIICHNLL